MATVNANFPSLVDVITRLDPDGGLAAVAELLTQTNEILMDMPFFEGNLPTGHKGTVRTSLPAAAWRLLNQGVPVGKSTTAQIVDSCGILENYSVVDEVLYNLNGQSAEWRLSEDVAFIEGINQQMATSMFYGNSSLNPEQPQGFAPRYSTRNVANAESAQNVLHGGGSGTDNTSIWLIVWGKNTCHGIYPKGSKAGLQVEDLGKKTLFDAAGGRYQGYETQYQWMPGYHVRDWRYLVRIANIDVSDLSTVSPANLIRLMIRAINLLPSGARTIGRPVFYMNRTVKSWLEIQTVENPRLGLHELKTGDGEERTAFRGIPISVCDAILTTEATVPA